MNVAPGKPGGAHQIDVTRDGLYRLDPKAKKFTVYRLSRTVRFAENDVWTNPAAFPNGHAEMSFKAGVACACGRAGGYFSNGLMSVRTTSYSASSVGAKPL